MNKVDLHLHTLISDGTDSLSEIIENVRKAELDLFSVTDHDSIKGGIMIPPMLAAIEPEQRTAFVRGIEFSCEDELGKYHILGYGYDPAVPGIAEVVAEGHMMRMKKTKARLEFLQKEFQFQFTEKEISELLSKDNPGKPHIANLMIQHGYAEDIKDAINHYINKKEFQNEHVRPEDAIRGILKSGGIPVLAHPTRLQHLIGFGLAGVEAYYSGFSPKIQSECLAFAEQFDLYITAGSDYHGGNKMIEIGWTNLEDMAEAPPGLLRFLQDVDIIS